MTVKLAWVFTATTCAVAGLMLRAPFLKGVFLALNKVDQISDETRASLQVEAGDLSGRSELILGTLQTQLELLGALLALGVFFAPWAATAALRIALD